MVMVKNPEKLRGTIGDVIESLEHMAREFESCETYSGVPRWMREDITTLVGMLDEEANYNFTEGQEDGD